MFPCFISSFKTLSHLNEGAASPFKHSRKVTLSGSKWSVPTWSMLSDKALSNWKCFRVLCPFIPNSRPDLNGSVTVSSIRNLTSLGKYKYLCSSQASGSGRLQHKAPVNYFHHWPKLNPVRVSIIRKGSFFQELQGPSSSFPSKGWAVQEGKDYTSNPSHSSPSEVSFISYIKNITHPP